ncbi:MAG: cbb3-type cytochrome c oxidase subunit I [Gammaproteobacteria bacterium]
MSTLPGLLPSGHDAVSIRVVYAYLISATFWLLVGTLYGLLAAVKLFWPDVLVTAWLSFGRIRPIHTSTVLLGWTTLALVGLSYYIAYRTSQVPIWRPALAYVGLGLWNLAILCGLITLSLGISTGPQEYREWIWPVALPFGLGLVINGYNHYRTVAARKISEIYISNWYILGAFCWLAVIYVVGYLPFYQGGLGNIVIQGYYMHNVVGMWFTPMVLGVTYWALPRILGRPIYSYALGVLGFWTNMLFYTLIGAHHYIFAPIPWWLQTTAILFSVGMMVPVWSGAGNFILTMRGSWGLLRRSYALMFLLVGVWGYALASTQGTTEAFRTANIYWHFTNYTVGHAHLAAYGFVAFLIWGAIYGLLPRITGHAPNATAIGMHFWLAFVGACIYVTSISAAGILQGLSWVKGESFIASIEAAAPMWLWRSIGGVLMVASHFVFAVNLWAMRPRVQSVAASRAHEALA